MAAPMEEKPEGRKIELNDVLYKYMPIAGGASSLIFSTYIMNPNSYRSVFGSYDVILSNALWFNAHLGTGLFIYGCKHQEKNSNRDRIMYSVYGALIVNFGSVLFWAATKRILPNDGFIRTVFGVATGVACLKIGKQFLESVDDLVEK